MLDMDRVGNHQDLLALWYVMIHIKQDMLCFGIPPQNQDPFWLMNFAFHVTDIYFVHK